MSAYIRPGLRVAGVAAVGAGVGYTARHYWNTTTFFFTTAQAESLPSDTKAALKKMAWKGFTELKLEKAETVNHNVKKLTFALPDDQSITGVPPVSMSTTSHHHSMIQIANASDSVSVDQTHPRRRLDPGFPTLHPGQRQW